MFEEGTFAKINSHEILGEAQCARINSREIFIKAPFAKINSREMSEKKNSRKLILSKSSSLKVLRCNLDLVLGICILMKHFFQNP